MSAFRRTISAANSWKSVRSVPGVATLNDEVAALHIAEFLEALEQRVIETLVSTGNKPHPPNFVGLLRARRQWPRRRTAEQRDELTPFQLIELHSVPRQPGVDSGYRMGRDQSAAGVELKDV
jgi:hypothetical protein